MLAKFNLSCNLSLQSFQGRHGERIRQPREPAYGLSPITSSTHSAKQIDLWMDSVGVPGHAVGQPRINRASPIWFSGGGASRDRRDPLQLLSDLAFRRPHIELILQVQPKLG
jgi:hypothetical protein